jgi:predicted butyrate kinase (DUF1464 family)
MKETETQAERGYEQVREAFAKLDTQDKAAFVLEATFDTIGQALHDVGQSVGDAIERLGKEDFFEDLFRKRERTPGAAEGAAPEAPPAAPPRSPRRSGTTPPAASSDEGLPPVA